MPGKTNSLVIAFRHTFYDIRHYLELLQITIDQQERILSYNSH